ncbi:hypothetical protein ACSNOC_08615, partial [Streptomyces sp. URMC 129]
MEAVDRRQVPGRRRVHPFRGPGGRQRARQQLDAHAHRLQLPPGGPRPGRPQRRGAPPGPHPGRHRHRGDRRQRRIGPQQTEERRPARDSRLHG